MSVPIKEIKQGKRFGYLTVLSFDSVKKEKNNRSCAWYLCKCVCDKLTKVRGPQLRNGMVQSCGCRRKDHLYDNLVGKKFNRWTVLRRDGKTKEGAALWECKCECGKIKKVRTHSLIAGVSKSCGCLKFHGRFTRTKDGYVFIYKPRHPNSDKKNYVAEHVFIMSEHLGRPLLKGEIVHHKNGIRNDNRLENLDLRIKNRHPNGQSVNDLIPYWIEMLKRYAPEKLGVVE